MPAARRLCLLVLLAALGGCSSEWTHNRELNERSNTTFPPNYRAEILEYMRNYLNDPTQVRDAVISEPALRAIEGRRRYSVCLRYNAKDADGHYVGSRDSLVLFRDGRFDHLIDSQLDRNADSDPARDLCKDASFQRFPELQNLKR
jgi:hypothetical protein